MTSLEREQFQALALRQAQLEEALAQLKIDLKELERRAESPLLPVEASPPIPPLPKVIAQVPPVLPPLFPPVPKTQEEIAPEATTPVVLPEYLTRIAAASGMTIPEPEPVKETIAEALEQPKEMPVADLPLPPLPETSEMVSVETPADKSGGLEFQFGRWLARIGVVFALITLISFSTLAYKNYYYLMGPWSKLSALALISVGLTAAGLRIERKNSKLTVYGRTLAGGGLACLYYTIYGATYVTPLQVIHSQFFGGLLLLGWSAYVLYLAEKKKSELLSVFAIALAYFSSAITPVGDFTMVANLLLSLTAVAFLVRNAWTGLSYLCLIGTYVGLLRQYVVYDSTSDFWFVLVNGTSFRHAAIYLTGAWVIYTAGVFLAQTPKFAAGKRMAFLCLNNGALIGLLTVAANLSGFGHIGPILCLVGGLFLAASWLAQRIRAEATEIASAYLMQGLTLVTGGLVIAYTGVTRGLLITVESVFLAAAGAYSRNIIMRFAAYISAGLGTAFLLDEITPNASHPWILIAGGAAAMLANAWLARREFWHEAREIASQRFVLSSAYYVLLATGLLALGLADSPLDETWMAPVMALTALVLTFSVYLVPLFELPVLIQALLLFALGKVAFPLDDSHVLWNELAVGAATMILVAWWPRQKSVRTDYWLQPLLVVYALAMTAVSACAVHPLVDEQGWMICASLLSLVFLAYGRFARTWSFAAAGQILLAASIVTFFFPHAGTFPWTWWAASIPIATTFFTAWLAQEWLRKTTDLSADSDLRGFLRVVIFGYQAMTVALIVRLVFGLVPDEHVPLTFFALGAALMAWNIKWPSSMGVRCAMVLDLFGVYDYFTQVTNLSALSSTWPNAVGLVFLLAQPALLRRWGTALVSIWEIRGVTLLANISTSVYIYWVIHPRVGPEGWMIAASLLSLGYLAYGAWTRMWQFILSGQVYLAMAIGTFLYPPIGLDSFPWVWWAALFPPAAVFLTAWLVHQYLPKMLTLPEDARQQLRLAAYVYQAVALGLAVRWIFGIVPSAEDTFALFLFAAGLLLWNVRWPGSFGARAGLLVSVIGMGNYLFPQTPSAFTGFTWADAAGITLFLVQPAILRHWGRELVTEAESWAVVLLSAGLGWIFVSHSIDVTGTHNMTMGWAIYALAVTVIGFIANERRQRWCGLIILVAAIVRVGVYDFWQFSDLYKVLTFFALTVICLGLSFLYYKFADRLKEWL